MMMAKMTETTRGRCDWTETEVEGRRERCRGGWKNGINKKYQHTATIKCRGHPIDGQCTQQQFDLKAIFEQ